MNELVPTINNTEAISPMDFPEASAMDRIPALDLRLAHQEPTEDIVSHPSRWQRVGKAAKTTGAVLLGAGLAAAAPELVSADDSDEASSSAAWPGVTQIIDGAEPEFNGDPEQERAVARLNFDNARERTPSSYSFRVPHKHPKTVRLKYDLNPLHGADGYVQLTNTVRLQTKRPGEDKWHDGKEYDIRTHDAQWGEKMRMKIAQRCRKGGKLIVRLIMTNKIDAIDPESTAEEPVIMHEEVKKRGRRTKINC